MDTSNLVLAGGRLRNTLGIWGHVKEIILGNEVHFQRNGHKKQRQEK